MPIDYPDCTDCCGGGTTRPCCGCTSVPFQYRVTFASIFNEEADDCAIMNRTWILAIDPIICQWQGSLSDGVGGGYTVSVDCVESLPGYARLFVNRDVAGGFGGGFWATYFSPLATWNCLGPNEFTLAEDFPACAGWPARVTVFPV